MPGIASSSRPERYCASVITRQWRWPRRATRRTCASAAPAAPPRHGHAVRHDYRSRAIEAPRCREAVARLACWAEERGLDFRHDPAGGSGAAFSRCGAWRYLLWRLPDPRGKIVGMGLLNPSTADEARDDPTIRQCRNRARQARLSGLVIWNLFAFRATRPADFKRAADPIGPDNDAAIALALALSARTILAWGNHGGHLGRDRTVLARCAGLNPLILGLTGEGRPRHPLYLPRTARLRGLPKER